MLTGNREDISIVMGSARQGLQKLEVEKGIPYEKKLEVEKGNPEKVKVS